MLEELVSGRQFRFEEPWRLTDKHLTVVVPIIRIGSARKREYVLVEEVKNKVKFSDTGAIDRIKVVGTNKPVLIRSGVIIEGVGTQSRAVETGKVVVPESVSEVIVKCVHASHPIRTGATFEVAEAYAPVEVHAMFLSKAGQGATWNAVNRYGAMAFRAVSETGRVTGISRDDLISTMRELHEFRKDVEDVISKMPVDRIGQVGIAILDLDGLVGLELFDHPDSWAAASKAVARKYADVLVREGESELFQLNRDAVVKTIMEFLSFFQECEERVVEENARSKTIALKGEKVVGERILLDGKEIHFIATRRKWKYEEKQPISRLPSVRTREQQPRLRDWYDSSWGETPSQAMLLMSSASVEPIFKKKAGMTLLESLRKRPKPWKELEEELGVTPRTLAKRLKEAEESELIEKLVRPTNGRQVYGLTPQARKELFKITPRQRSD
jgi:DNA-binding HxlR family transcriptional regulator